MKSYTSRLGYLSLALFLGGCSFLLPIQAKAETLFKQGNGSTYTTNGTYIRSSGAIMLDGSWLTSQLLTGPISGLSFSMRIKGDNASTTYKAGVTCYAGPANGHLVSGNGIVRPPAPCNGIYPLGGNNQSAVSSDRVVVGTTEVDAKFGNLTMVNDGSPFQMSASTTEIYGFYIQSVDGSSHLIIRGDTASTTQAELEPDPIRDNGVKIPIAEIDYNTFSSTNFPTLSNLRPTNGSISTSTQIQYSFDWIAGANYNINSWAIQLTDISTGIGSSILLTGPITGTSGTVSYTTSCQAGHIYSWVPELSDSTGNNYQGAQQQFGCTASATIALNQFFSPPDSGSNTSTSTDWLGIIPLFSRLTNVVPFGYIWEFSQLWASSTQNLTNSKSIPLLDVNLNSLNIGSGTPFANIAGEIVISTSSIMTLMTQPIYDFIMAIQTTSFWVSFGFYLWRRGITVAGSM